MKNLILGFLVFITTFLKGQSVDPETFPTVTSGIGIKYLYTNTGGEGKILVDSIATRVRAYWTNGVNGQDSLGLGGTLVQPTNIYTNHFPMNFTNSSFDGFGRFYFGTTITNALFYNYGSYLASANVGIDSTVGNELLNVDSRILDLSTGQTVGIQSVYSPIGGFGSYWDFIQNNSAIKAKFSTNEGFIIEPRDVNLSLTYAGSEIFNVLNPSGGKIFTIKADGIINEVLPSYADDAAAGVGGLLQGDRYQTSGAGASPLNVAGIVMIKQ